MTLSYFSILFILLSSGSVYSHHTMPIKTICKKVALAETRDTHTNSDGSLVTNMKGDRYGRMQIYSGVVKLYNNITGVNLPLDSYKDETLNKIIGYWYIRYLVAVKRNKHKAVNSYNMGPNRPYANPAYLYKVFGHTNFLNGKKAIGYWHYAGKKYPQYRDFP